MQYARIALFGALALAATFAHRAHAGGDPLGLYVGGALGQSDVRAEESVFGGPPGFAAHRNAWKLLLGLRPISLLGAELDYLDFGHARFSSPLNSFGNALRIDAHPKATAIFGVIYAPIPIPLLDVYAKAGVARLQTDVTAGSFCAMSPCVVTTTAPLALNERTLGSPMARACSSNSPPSPDGSSTNASMQAVVTRTSLRLVLPGASERVTHGLYCVFGSANVLGSVRLPPGTVRMHTPMMITAMPTSCKPDRCSCSTSHPKIAAMAGLT
jgi:hypothetical protein